MAGFVVKAGLQLSVGSSRAIARSVIPWYIREGYSASRIVRELRSVGLGYRYQTILADVREISGLQKYERQIRAVANTLKIPRSIMVETDLRRARRYRVFAQMVYTDIDTGEEEDQFVSFYTDQLENKQTMTEQFFNQFRGTSSTSYRTVTSFEITSVEHQRGWGY